jgi:hypothetical protein
LPDNGKVVRKTCMALVEFKGLYLGSGQGVKLVLRVVGLKI